ncbi:MAG: sugar phosphate nucleotidyltransferase, partial [Pseudomonadota bacterium]
MARDPGDVKVVILAGGKGTRLRPFTVTFPKPLVPLGDMPILEVVLTQLRRHGFRDVTLTVGHLAGLIRAFVGEHPSLTKDLGISFVTEETPTGTAGSLASINGLTGTTLVMNGDVLTNLDYRALVDDHEASGAALTIAVHTVSETVDFGVLEADAAGTLRAYREKPSQSYDVSMGVYVYSARALSYIAPGAYLDFPDLVGRLLAAGEQVRVYRNDAFWLDIGRPDDYARAQDLFANDPGFFGLDPRSPEPS